MSTIKGVWVFNETVSLANVCASVDFDNLGSSYDGIGADSTYIVFLRDSEPTIPYVYESGWGVDEVEHRTVDFGETEQEVPDDFYAWFTANATEQMTYVSTYVINAETLVGIGDAIREKAGTKTKYTPTQMVEGIGAVYEAGKQAEYDKFWDVYQDKGNRTQYAHAFRGSGWTDATFKPKYDIVCDEWDNYLFSGSRIVDIKGILESQGVTLDTSKVSGLTYFFQNCSATVRIPALDMRSCTSFLGAFYGCMALQEIEMNHVREDLTGNNAFLNCTALTAVKITGTIGTSAFNFKHSPLLTNESVQSIIGCLKDLTGETTQTVTFHADVGAKITDEQKATITAKNWTLVY